MNSLKIYKSSAGSGKTFTLVLEYLKLALNRPEDYKSILAITFTNKAAGEMKSRIIDALVSLSNKISSPIQTILEVELPGTDISARASKVLKHILHDYTSFSVSTIDSFFQKILRSLAREINLPLNMKVEVEIDDAILDVTDSLLREVGIDKELTDWLTQLAIMKMDDEKGWNLEKDIESVAKELFKEDRHKSKVLTREEIQHQYQKLNGIKNDFEKRMREFGEQGIKEIEKAGLSVADFAYGKTGVAAYFGKISTNGNATSYQPTTRVLEALEDSQKWSTKSSPSRTIITGLADRALIPKLRETLAFYDTRFKDYLTATEILKKIYLFGIVNDLQKHFSQYRNENNVILLSDTTRLLGDFIEGNDTPFLYEKTGNRYKHLLIDEFQDTSVLQWKNLLPLIINALGSGFTTLVVGDAKQSIYRWRGGNMNLLLRDLMDDLKNFRSLMKEEVLSTNFRSKKVVVDFNNNFFSTTPNVANDEIRMNDFPPLRLAYDPGLQQKTFSKNEQGGFVRIKFLTSQENEEGEKIGWKENALDEMLGTIQTLLNKGYSKKDICILVRKNNDGNEIANFLISNGIREIVSPDSLMISASPEISFLISVFRFLADNKNTIARSEIIYYYRAYILLGSEAKIHDVFSDHRLRASKKKKIDGTANLLFEGLEENIFNRLLPESFTAHLAYLGKLPVYELSEQLVSSFGLSSKPDAYIQRFQDLVLEYSMNYNSSLDGFLKWWDSTTSVREASVIIPENTDAIRIMTIHRSKGLQFPVVIMPFADWELKLKANKTIWMNTSGSPFAELGVVAVSTGSKLLETYFKEEYENEINQSIIDNINLLYVAFTRAEEKLYVCCPSDNGKDLNSISKLIARTCKKLDEGSIESLESGIEDTAFPKKEKNTFITNEPLTSYPITRWQEKLALSTHSNDLLALMEDEMLTKINYGILVHEVLAMMSDTAEIDLILNKIVFEGRIGEEEKKKLKKEITEILDIDKIKEVFDPSYYSLAERELIQPSGDVLRPDRVIIKDGHAIVIDFKTGKREARHDTQVQKYVDVLKKMNYASVSGRLVYLAERKIVEV